MVTHHAGNLVFALSAAIDLLLACAAVAWARRSPRRLLLAAPAVLALLALKGLALIEAGVEMGFGVMHVLWLDLVVVLPATAAVALVVIRPRPPALVACALLALLLAPLGAYASFVEPGRLVEERTALRLPAARAGGEPVRVGLIADLQFERLGAHEREAVERLMRMRPDLILLAGDYHQGPPASFERELPALRRLLARLEAPGGVYAVQGDVEGPVNAARVFEGTGVRLLFNERVRVRVGGRHITLAGVERDFASGPARRAARRLESGRGDGDVRLLLAHRPDVVLSLARNTRVDLVASGHTHGGQLQLPLVGPPIIASQVPRDVGGGGLHDLDGRRIYVSRGVGVERGQAPRLRLGAPPEVSLITLR